MIVMNRGPVRIAEVWFDDTPLLDGIDVVRYIQRSNPAPNSQSTVFTTPRIDLTASTEALFQAFEKDARYEIRRAEQKDVMRYESTRVSFDRAALSEFVRFYDGFAAAKDLPRLSRARLSAYAGAGALDLSVARDESGAPLVWHSHFCSGGIARLLHSASHFRAIGDSAQRSRIGRVNRLHHWLDMLRFKEAGFARYDLGGWYSGTSDQDQLRINGFKKQFGGTVVETFNSQRSLTIKGAVFLMAVRVRDRLRARVGP